MLAPSIGVIPVRYERNHHTRVVVRGPVAGTRAGESNSRSRQRVPYPTPLPRTSRPTSLNWSAKRVVRFYNKRGTAEQWIKEGKYAVNWTRLSCHDFVDNQVRLQLFVLAYNLGNFLRRLALPRSVRHWSLTTLRDKLIKIEAKVVRHARYVTFQLAEVAVPRELFAATLRRIQRLGFPPPLEGCG